MLNNLAKGSIIDVWWGPECASECDSINFYKTIMQQKLSNLTEAIMKNGNFYSVKYSSS